MKYSGLVCEITGLAIATSLIPFSLQAATLTSQSAIVTDSAATFNLGWDTAPDFQTVDQFGRDADSFQYYIDAQGADPPPVFSPYDDIETIIRGDEINVAGDIPIRNATPLGSGGPNSGGWGSVRGSVDYTTSDDGTAISFTVPLDLLGVENSQFSYQLIALNYGRDYASVNAVGSNNNKPVPEPSSFVGTASLIVMASFLWWRRASKRKRLQTKS